MPSTLVLGGARSGKSAHAQRLAERSGLRPVMIATAEAWDDEMAGRIARHQAERGASWRTVEAPLDLVSALARLAADEIAVIDCLTLWVSNLMHAGRDVAVETGRLLEALPGRATILVANEVGLGIVPDNALARAFRDEAGRANQRVAAAADEAVFIAAGLPLTLKPSRPL